MREANAIKTMAQEGDAERSSLEDEESVPAVTSATAAEEQLMVEAEES